MIEGIATSDWHLLGLRKHFDNHDARAFTEIDKIYQYAIRNGVKHIFVPGDISDTPTLPFDSYIPLVLHLKKYDGLIHTHYIAGNHDFSDIDKTSLDMLAVLCKTGFFTTFNLYLQPKRVVIDDVPVNFLPYPCLKTLSKKNKGALNFAHVEYSGAIGDNGRTLKTKHELQVIENDFTVSGHIHQYQYMKARRAVYCGNPYQKNFGEALPKGFIHFKAENKNGKIEFKHKFVDAKPNFVLQNVTIEDISDLKKLKQNDNIRYKLHVASDIVLPSDILIQYPNITGGVFYASGKKANIEEDLQELAVQKSSISVTTGLTRFLSSQGYNKSKIKEAKKLVESARNHLGF
jgi:DNA repair exonuclease SbcCD nuclease subunit